MRVELVRSCVLPDCALVRISAILTFLASIVSFGDNHPLLEMGLDKERQADIKNKYEDTLFGDLAGWRGADLLADLPAADEDDAEEVCARGL